MMGKTNLKSISQHLAINWHKIGHMLLWRVNIKWLYARYLCSRGALGLCRSSATIGYLVYKLNGHSWEMGSRLNI